MDTGVPRFGLQDGGVILRAAINHYKAISPITVDVWVVEILSLSALRRLAGRLIKASGLGLTGGNLTD